MSIAMVRYVGCEPRRAVDRIFSLDSSSFTRKEALIGKPLLSPHFTLKGKPHE
jgi:hypothetical protein